MITRIARFGTRVSSGEDKNQTGFFMGICLKEGAHLLKPNSVYEIRDICGVLTLDYVGESSNSSVWYKDISSILDNHKGAILCTLQEFEDANPDGELL